LDAKSIVTWLAIATAIATGAARFQSLEEAKANSVQWITELSLSNKALEARVSSLERDRAMLERIHTIEVRLTAMEEREREHNRGRR
jgi:cell division protein FtsB